MPMDRLVTVVIQAIGDYDASGQYIAGPDRFYRRWATLIDTSISRYLSIGGSRAEEDAAYRMRYFPELAAGDVRIAFLVEDDGDSYKIISISEPTGRDGNTRRRWLEVQCIRQDFGVEIPPGSITIPVTPDTPDTEIEIPDTMDMGGLLASPTFTLLSTVTRGDSLDDDLDFPPADEASILAAWNSGTYWAFLMDFLYVVSSQVGGQSSILIPIRREVQTGTALHAFFVCNSNRIQADRGYLWLAAGTVRLHFDDTDSLPANAICNLYGVS